MAKPYVPINCEFHDVLEATATRARVAVIVFENPVGQQETCHAHITDLIAHDGIEYMQLDSGDRVRLDDIVSVDGVMRSDFTSG